MTNNDIITRILQDEGGFVNNPDDAGGPTNLGITLQTYRDFEHNQDLTVEDLKKLTPDTARLIYYQIYITGPGFVTIDDDRVRSLVVDMWVQHRPRTATLLFQKVLNLPGDGILGPVTLEGLRQMKHAEYDELVGERFKLYGRIVSKNPNQLQFLNGWMNRCAEFLET